MREDEARLLDFLFNRRPRLFQDVKKELSQLRGLRIVDAEAARMIVEYGGFVRVVGGVKWAFSNNQQYNVLRAEIFHWNAVDEILRDRESIGKMELIIGVQKILGEQRFSKRALSRVLIMRGWYQDEDDVFRFLGHEMDSTLRELVKEEIVEGARWRDIRLIYPQVTKSEFQRCNALVKVRKSNALYRRDFPER